MKAITILLPVAITLGLAACDRPARTVDKSDPPHSGVALRPSSEPAAARSEKAAPDPAQPTQAKSDSPAADAALSEKVRQALVTEHGLNARDLQVIAQNGVVTLSGKIEEKSDQERMMLVTMSIDGVRSVVSNLVVDRPA